MTRSFAFSLAITCAACWPGDSPSSPAGDAGAGADAAADASPDASDDASKVDDLSALLEPVRAASSLPSLAGAVFDDARLIAIGAVGLRKAGDSAHVTVDDQWHLGSDTKAMTATLVAMLVEDGAVSWDTTVGAAFPGWTIDPGYHDVTLKMLLMHRGGAPHDVPAAIWSAMWQQPFDSVAQRRAAVQAMLAQPPAQAPGTYTYANAGYMMVGAAIELATGKAWEQMMTDRIFGPLGMASCGFGAPGTAGKVDEPWGHTVNNGVLTPVSPGPNADNPPSLGPAGTVHCSLADWGKFLREHLKGARKEPAIVSQADMDLLHTPWSGGDYGLGWIVTSRPWGGGTVLTHSGSNTLWYATVWIAPATNRIFVAATNRGDPVAATGVDAAFGPMIAKYGGP